MAKISFLVFSNPVEGQEKEYNDWYDNVHLGDVLKVPGVLSAQRFRYVDAKDPVHRYLAIYDWEVEDPDSARKALDEARKAGLLPMVDAIDSAGVHAVFFEAITDRREATGDK